MAFSVLTKRSKSQDSPTFWLSLVAGSLFLHLVLLLLGRWYFSQTASAPAGLTQAPLDFVEIDPNASPLKSAKPIAPSNTQTQAELPKAAPPQESEVTQAPNSIANLPRQTPERSQPRIAPSSSPTPTTPVNQPTRTRREEQRSQAGQPPSNQTTTRPNPTTPSTSRPTTDPSTSGASGTSPASGASGSQPETGNPTNPTTGNPTTENSTTENPTAPRTGGPTNPTTENSTSPVDGGEPLWKDATFQGTLSRSLERDPNERQRDGAKDIRVRNETISAISVTLPDKLPVQVLNLKIFVVLDRDGLVINSPDEPMIRDDSPSFQTHPELMKPEIRENLNAAVFQLLAHQKDLFEVIPEANTDPEQKFSRIAQLQLKVSQ